MRIAVIAGAIVALTGCGAVYQKKAEEFLATQPESAWGAGPPPDHLEGEAYLIKRQLKDPYSAQIASMGVKRAVLPASMASTETVPVYCSYQSVNAKNSYGGYTGAKTWEFCYRDGKLFSQWAGEGHARLYLE